MDTRNLYSCLFFMTLHYFYVALQAKGIQDPQGYDCSNIWERNKASASGIYFIKPKGSISAFPVYCEMTMTGGWTVIQLHNGENELSFQQMWENYKNGFGNLTGEHWLGLRHIHRLTNQKGRPCALRISVGDFDDQEAYADYRPFSIGDENEFYRLTAGKYSGTAGDAFLGDAEREGINQHGSFFSTQDNPNDSCHPMCRAGDMMFPSCSFREQSGWWFSECGSANLNGAWQSPPDHMYWASSVSWPTWRPDESLKYSKMYLIHK